MKTIQELNSKWYWRLVKVIWIITITFLTGAIIIGSGNYFYESNHTYNPSNINKVSLKIKDFESKTNELTDIYNSYLGIEKLGPKLVENIGVLDEDGNIFRAYDQVTRKKLIEHQEDIKKIFENGLTINSIYLLRSYGYNIEGVNFSNSQDGKKYIYPEDATFDKYIKGLDITINDTYGEMKKDDILSGINAKNNIITDAKNSFEKIKKGQAYGFYSTKYINDFNELDNLLGNRNYISITGWIKIIFYELGVITSVIACIFIINYILRGILYYIILGKFNPEK